MSGNWTVKSISDRLSLRTPQRRSLEILERIVELAPPKKGTNPEQALEAIQGEFPGVKGFERTFPNLCFSLATGVGKTRLMGAFIAYLHLTKGLRHFFVLAPNLTIYNKLVADFTPNTPKGLKAREKKLAEFSVALKKDLGIFDHPKADILVSLAFTLSPSETKKPSSISFFQILSTARLLKTLL